MFSELLYQDKTNPTEPCRITSNSCTLTDMDTAMRLGVLDVLIELPNRAGYTPLNIASMTGEYNIVQKLLHHNVSVDKDDKGGRTPLINAAINGHTEIIGLLLNHGANINAKSKTGETALYRAVEEGWKDSVKVLVNDGAQIDQLSVNNYTALHMAAQNNEHTLVAWFFEGKITDETKKNMINNTSNHDHHTPLTCAIEHKGDLLLVQFLVVSGGADISIKGSEGKTPLEWAQKRGKKDIVAYLESRKAP